MRYLIQYRTKYGEQHNIYFESDSLTKVKRHATKERKKLPERFNVIHILEPVKVKETTYHLWVSLKSDHYNKWVDQM